MRKEALEHTGTGRFPSSNINARFSKHFGGVNKCSFAELGINEMLV